MTYEIGKVIDIYIPNQTKNGIALDIMDNNLIGFVVQVENELKKIIVDQNAENIQIKINDFAKIIYNKISGKDFIDIVRFDGEDYE